MFESAKKRAESFGISGLTYRLTLGVVKVCRSFFFSLLLLSGSLKGRKAPFSFPRFLEAGAKAPGGKNESPSNSGTSRTSFRSGMGGNAGVYVQLFAFGWVKRRSEAEGKERREAQRKTDTKRPKKASVSSCIFSS